MNLKKKELGRATQVHGDIHSPIQRVLKFKSFGKTFCFVSLDSADYFRGHYENLVGAFIFIISEAVPHFHQLE